MLTADQWAALAIAAAILLRAVYLVDKRAQEEFDERKEGWK